jgi:hypothetical protein
MYIHIYTYLQIDHREKRENIESTPSFMHTERKRERGRKRRREGRREGGRERERDRERIGLVKYIESVCLAI